MKIFWTPTARSTYLSILQYLEENWSERETIRFIGRVEKTIERIRKNPEMFVASLKNPNVRKGFIIKQVSLIYKVVIDKREIHLISFWDNRRNPNQLKY